MTSGATERGAPARVLLDCDPGIDDALAIVFGCGHPGLDLAGLQRIADRLYEKPLAELTRLELANLIGTTKAIRKGLIDVNVVRQPDGPSYVLPDQQVPSAT